MALCRSGKLIALCLLHVVLLSCFSWYFFSNYGTSTLNDPTDYGAEPSQQQTVVDPAFQLELDPNKNMVILITSFRGGSSILGQLFDHNPSVQYLFEPFHDQAIRNLYSRKSLIGAREDHSQADLRMLYLQQILHNCTVFPTPFYEKYEYCGTQEEHLVRFNSTECVQSQRKSGFSHQQICRYRGTVVMKVIRVQHLADILKIKNIKSANVKIVHLLRNPIPMLMSRKASKVCFLWDRKTVIELGETTEQCRIRVAWESYNHCFNTIKSIKYLESQPWLQERYMRLTHEELSLQPLKTAQTVYDFLGMEFSDELKQFFLNTTTGQLSKGQRQRQGALNTIKNSSAILKKWKEMKSNTIKLYDLFSIEAQCSELFREIKSNFVVDNMSYRYLQQLYTYNII